MGDKNIVDQYNSKRATVFNGHQDWVLSRAREVDLDTDRELVSDLAQIMRLYTYWKKWDAVSSNNVYWEGSDTPLSVIHVKVPEGDEYVTLVNPRIKELGSVNVLGVEECGSIPGLNFRVPRSTYVVVEATMLTDDGWRDVNFNYGIENPVEKDGHFISDNGRMDNAFFLQHEIDHLEGLILPIRGSMFVRYYNDWNEQTPFSKWTNIMVNKGIEDGKYFFKSIGGDLLNLPYGSVLIGFTGLELVLGDDNKWVLHKPMCEESDSLQPVRLCVPQVDGVMNYFSRISREKPVLIPEVVLRGGIEECSCVEDLVLG